MATIDAAQDAIRQLCERAAKIWEIPYDAVEWEDGYAKPAGANAGADPHAYSNAGAHADADAYANADAVSADASGHYCDSDTIADAGR